MEITKKSKTNGILTIKPIDYDVAREMIIKNHYSKKWNKSFGKLNFGIYRDDELLGCAVFGNMMNTKSAKNITDYPINSIIELNRLWVDDILGKNTETIFLSSCFSLIKSLHPEIKFIQSFADGRLGCGTIYKASNFRYYGFSESLFFENKENGEVFHKVPLECTNRPVGFLNKNRLYLDNKLSSFTVKTYRYIFHLYKPQKNIQSIKLKEQPYPEYSIGYEFVDFKHSDSLLSRLYLMYKMIDDKDYMNKAYNLIIDKSKIEEQKNNKSVQWFEYKYLKNPKNLQNLFNNSDIS